MRRASADSLGRKAETSERQGVGWGPYLDTFRYQPDLSGPVSGACKLEGS